MPDADHPDDVMGTVREVMSPEPVTLPSTASMEAAARLMQQRDIGDVVVVDGDRLVGIVTDRDLVVRGLAAGLASDTQVSVITSTDPAVVAPEDEITRAVRLMEEHAIRRLPVVDDGELVGMVTLGDLARERDARSALGRISEAPPDR